MLSPSSAKNRAKCCLLEPLAASQRDPAMLRRYVRVFTEGVAFVAFPIAFGLAVVAEDFVLTVFGDAWSATVGPLRLLALVAVLRSITPVMSQTLIAVGEARKNMEFAVTTAVVVPVLLVIGSRWGITGVAAAWLVGQPLVTGPVLLRHMLRATDMRLAEWLDALRPAGTAALAMVAVVLAAQSWVPEAWPRSARFAVEVAAGAAAYGIGISITYRHRFAALALAIRQAQRGAPVGPVSEVSR